MVTDKMKSDIALNHANETLSRFNTHRPVTVVVKCGPGQLTVRKIWKKLGQFVETVVTETDWDVFVRKLEAGGGYIDNNG